MPVLYHKSLIAQQAREQGMEPVTSYEERPRFVEAAVVGDRGVPTPKDGVDPHNLVTKTFKHYKGCPCADCKFHRAEPGYIKSLAKLHNKRVGSTDELYKANPGRPKVFPSTDLELLNGQLIS